MLLILLNSLPLKKGSNFPVGAFVALEKGSDFPIGEFIALGKSSEFLVAAQNLKYWEIATLTEGSN